MCARVETNVHTHGYMLIYILCASVCMLIDLRRSIHIPIVIILYEGTGDSELLFFSYIFKCFAI